MYISQPVGRFLVFCFLLLLGIAGIFAAVGAKLAPDRLRVDVDIHRVSDSKTSITFISHEEHLVIKDVTINDGKCNNMTEYRTISGAVLKPGETYSLTTDNCKVGDIHFVDVVTDKRTYRIQLN